MQGLQWLTTAAFLYAEIFIAFLLCLPFIRNSSWRAIFHSRILAVVRNYGNFYFLAMCMIISLLFLDSVREMHKYGKVEASHTVDLKNNPHAEFQAHMKLFRAQRNFYISGFSLFMLMVLHRLITLVTKQATLEASHEAVVKQAQGAGAQAKLLLDENDKLRKARKGDIEAKDKEDKEAKDKEDKEAKDKEDEEAKEKDDKDEKDREAVEEKMNNLTLELTQKTAELEKANKEVEAMKSQSGGLTKEYDRLLEEHAKLEAKLAIQNDSSKKDD